jgi:hypothetical protein
MLAGAPHVTATEAFAASAVTESGTDGTAFIAEAVEAVEAAEVPITLVAVTLNV